VSTSLPRTALTIPLPESTADRVASRKTTAVDPPLTETDTVEEEEETATAEEEDVIVTMTDEVDTRATTDTVLRAEDTVDRPLPTTGTVTVALREEEIVTVEEEDLPRVVASETITDAHRGMTATVITDANQEGGTRGVPMSVHVTGAPLPGGRGPLPVTTSRRTTNSCRPATSGPQEGKL
jgi:hypothetical protein